MHMQKLLHDRLSRRFQIWRRRHDKKSLETSSLKDCLMSEYKSAYSKRHQKRCRMPWNSHNWVQQGQHRGLFEFRVLPFGLCNAPAIFERLMEFVLAGLVGTSCLVYLDDIVIFSRTFEDHISRLTDVLTRLRQANLKLKPTKCFLFRQEITYLGHVVSKEGIATDPSKIAAMDEYPPPGTFRSWSSSLDLHHITGALYQNLQK